MLVYLGIPIIILSYLIGSVSMSYLIGKYIYKIDITKKGSGNAGGANAARIMGLKVGIISGLFDLFKGTLAVYIASVYTRNGVYSDLIADPNWIVVLSAFAVVIGHCYSILMKFKGGKGGATTAGVFLYLSPEIFGILLFIWILVVGATRFTSLGNLIAIVVIQFVLGLRAASISQRMTDFESITPYVVLGLSLLVLIYYKHNDNIVRLSRGVERKFGESETKA